MRLLSEFSKCSDRKIKTSKNREIARFRTIFFFHNILTISLNVAVPITFLARVCMALCRNAILRPFFTMRTEQNSVFLNMNRKFGTCTRLFVKKVGHFSNFSKRNRASKRARLKKRKTAFEVKKPCVCALLDLFCIYCKNRGKTIWNRPEMTSFPV